MLYWFCFFFFKQKTAYEMRISDWSSDVFSSDLNAEALDRTIATGEAHYWSRSRGEVWHKGGTSGNVQKLIELLVDCDQDAIWMKVEPAGPACHTGARSCFYRRLQDGSLERVPD